MRLRTFVYGVISVLGLSPLVAQNVVSTHSVSIDIVGLMYGYELPLGDKFSLIARAGTQAGIGYSSSYSIWGGSERRWSVGVYPVLSVEPRFYYNLSKRYVAGKNTFGNSGGFLSLNIQYFFPPYYRRHIDGEGGLLVTPFWGFRRVWYEHFLFELGGGINISFADFKSVSAGPAFDIRIGYLF